MSASLTTQAGNYSAEFLMPDRSWKVKDAWYAPSSLESLALFFQRAIVKAKRQLQRNQGEVRGKENEYTNGQSEKQLSD